MNSNGNKKTKFFFWEQISLSIKYRELIFHNALQEIKTRYIRTTIGPWWSSLSVGIFILSFGIIGSKLWGLEVDVFMPMFCSGYIIWLLISSIISESTTLLSSSANLLHTSKIPIIALIISMILKNIILFFHHLFIFFLVCFFLSHEINLNILMIVPSLIILFIIGIVFTFLWTIVCTRFSDIGQLTNTLLQIVFFLTPIFWPADRLSGIYFKILIDFNPIHQVLNLVRQPLLGNPILVENIKGCFVIFIILLFLSIFFGNKYKKSIIFYL